jgi:hypothetical protein
MYEDPGIALGILVAAGTVRCHYLVVDPKQERWDGKAYI